MNPFIGRLRNIAIDLENGVKKADVAAKLNALAKDMEATENAVLDINLLGQISALCMLEIVLKDALRRLLEACEQADDEGDLSGHVSGDLMRAARLALENKTPYGAMIETVQQAPNGWQSIETAPKDGTKFLASGGGLDRVSIVEWCDRVGAWDADYVMLDDSDHESEGYIRPTHWMPLPAPPLTPEG